MGKLPPEIIEPLMGSINSHLPKDVRIGAVSGGRTLGVQSPPGGSLTPCLNTFLTSFSHRAAVKYVSRSILQNVLLHLQEIDKSSWPDPAPGEAVPLASEAEIVGDQLTVGYKRGDNQVLQFPSITLPAGWY